MWYELNETAGEIRLRTAELELGWSRDNGAPVWLSRAGGPSVLGYGALRPGLDVALAGAANWTTSRSFARYLAYRVEARDDAVEFDVIVGLGPLKLIDRYTVSGELVQRQATIENVGLDDVQVWGLRLLLPNARVGNPERCGLSAPGNSVRPQVSLAVAATQRREVLPRRFFAPGLRGGSALEPAPTQGPGLLALHDDTLPQTLLCWYNGEADAALPYVEGQDGNNGAVSLTHEVALAGWLRPGGTLRSGPQCLLLVEAPWATARVTFRDTQARIGAPALLEPADWLAEAAIYTTHPAKHGGLAGLAAELPALAELGVGVLVLQPLCPTAGGPYHLLDLEQIDPSIGDAEELRQLVAHAHGHNIRVLLDLPLQGFAGAAPLLAEHPTWFVRDQTGGVVVGQPAETPAASAHPGVRVAAGLHNLDWHVPQLQAYLLGWAVAQVERFDLDGYRAVAPYSPALNWSRRGPDHASDGARMPLALLRRLRSALRARRSDAALIATLPGPAFGAACDGVMDYPVHHMFVHTALGRMMPAELAAYLDDLRDVVPTGVARLGFVESHDTWEINPLADGLRGSRLSRLLLAGMTLCGLVPTLWAGQEQGEEAFLRSLLGLWRGEEALRHGTIDLHAARCDSPAVLAVLREHAGRRLLGLLHFGSQRALVGLELPAAVGAPRELLAAAPLGVHHCDTPGCLRLDLEPFSAYCLEL